MSNVAALRPRPLTDGEKMIWSAAYTAALSAKRSAKFAARAAREAVDRARTLRRLDKDTPELDPETRAMLGEMLG
jgi:hypothetical protein